MSAKLLMKLYQFTIISAVDSKSVEKALLLRYYSLKDDSANHIFLQYCGPMDLKLYYELC